MTVNSGHAIESGFLIENHSLPSQNGSGLHTSPSQLERRATHRSPGRQICVRHTEIQTGCGKQGIWPGAHGVARNSHLSSSAQVISYFKYKHNV